MMTKVMAMFDNGDIIEHYETVKGRPNYWSLKHDGFAASGGWPTWLTVQGIVDDHAKVGRANDPLKIVSWEQEIIVS